MIDECSINAYKENGFAIFRGAIDRSVIDELIFEISQFGKSIVGEGFDFYSSETKFVSKEKQSLLYDRLRYLPSMSRLSGNVNLIYLLRELGLTEPVLMGCCNMRYDVPHDVNHLFAWHQDSLYLLGSLNAVTLWIPLTNVNLNAGTIEVIPRSHLNGILPFKRISGKIIAEYIPFLQRDLSLDMDVIDVPVSIDANPGDVVVFSQFLLHRSTINHSSMPRWTAQVRVSDLNCAWFKKNKYPTGDRKNIFFCDYPGFKHSESEC
ncbi:phytanoyl-CoA dioxygenase family protein [Deefgea tanakiae]|uniref:Phytanoyl-CoA dioxygenase family protein n=1 Tax=Deefgea tanakiae TaxID=2865840 RepID=A0ABX8ZBR4_9NEIS|nr:phytanoyl-CoA dioxygenase family protein [Deefgea tanakiae]QZA79205.1 phytanoyl-CoA dioxygenase family protein [Deefgea tanakiae]